MPDSTGWLARADSALADLLATEPGRRPGADGPRRLMAMIKAAATCSVTPGSRWSGHPEPARAARVWAGELAGLQRDDGLFDVGGNVASPPDTSFVINDLGVTHTLISGTGRLSAQVEAWAQVRDQLHDIAVRSQEALLTGGVHTPNHRWELSAALVRLDRVVGGDRGARRARDWLAERVDIDADGLYSERSPNYAAHVSNPCLLVLADALDEPVLAELVHANLHAMIDLTDDGEVETVLSRRQDQHAPFPTGPFALQWRRFAVREGCARCAVHAASAALADGFDPVDALAQSLLDPTLERPLPPAANDDRPGTRVFGLGLVRRRDVHGTVTVYAGSDLPRAGRIASGLACNPTFLRMRSGRVLLDSVRLSRQFFGLGPFRATSWHQDGDTTVLTEEVGAGYYLPLEASARRPDGAYDLHFEGRFAARMSFAEREERRVLLRTEVQITTAEHGVVLDVQLSGARVAYALELAFRGGGALTGGTRLDEERVLLPAGSATYRVGDDALSVVRADTVPGVPERTVPAFYDPGEAYTVTGGTDARSGPRLYLTGWSDQKLRVAVSRAGPASPAAAG